MSIKIKRIKNDEYTILVTKNDPYFRRYFRLWNSPKKGSQEYEIAKRDFEQYLIKALDQQISIDKIFEK